MKRGSIVKGLAIAFLVTVVVALAAGSVVYAKVWSNRSASTASVAEENAEPGIVIASVAPDGPAAQAGVMRGDILLTMDGEAVDNAAQLQNQLAEHKAGDEVELKVLHGDEERILTATLDEQNGKAYLGLTPCGGCHFPFLNFGQVEGEQGRFAMPDMEDMPFWGKVAPWLGDSVQGALIVSVVEAGPAAEAGLQEGDLVVAVDDQNVDAEHGLADLITSHQPGDTVTLNVQRSGEDEIAITVELGEHPEQAGAAYLGVEYRPAPVARLQWGEMAPEDMLPFELPDTNLEQGAIIRSVTDDSPAQTAGLARGDVITTIDGTPVENPQDVVDAVTAHQPGDKIMLTVYSSDEEERELEVTLAEHPDEAGRAYLGVSIGGFARFQRSEGSEMPDWLQPFQEFFRQQRGNGNRFFDPNQGFDFQLPPRLQPEA